MQNLTIESLHENSCKTRHMTVQASLRVQSKSRRQKPPKKLQFERDSTQLTLERPLDRYAAAAILGVSVRYLFTLRRQYEERFEVCEWRGRKPVFYSTHIGNFREAMKWEATNRKKKYRRGIHSGKTALGATTSTSRGKDTGGRRASAIHRRLK